MQQTDAALHPPAIWERILAAVIWACVFLEPVALLAGFFTWAIARRRRPFLAYLATWAALSQVAIAFVALLVGTVLIKQGAFRALDIQEWFDVIIPALMSEPQRAFNYFFKIYNAQQLHAMMLVIGYVSVKLLAALAGIVVALARPWPPRARAVSAQEAHTS